MGELPIRRLTKRRRRREVRLVLLGLVGAGVLAWLLPRFLVG